MPLPAGPIGCHACVCFYHQEDDKRKYFGTSWDSRSHSSSPTVVSSNDGASFVPPSPTLSTQSSAHFTTSLSLRDNKPEERSGYSSLYLLPDKVSTHHRKASNATFTSSHEGHSSIDETEPDHGGAEYGMVALNPSGRPVSQSLLPHIRTSIPHPTAQRPTLPNPTLDFLATTSQPVVHHSTSVQIAKNRTKRTVVSQRLSSFRMN